MLLRKILFPFSLLYALVVRYRNYLYDAGIKKSTVFRTKTICIGNLSVGGTGKTPMTEYLIGQLKNDHKVAVLSRGYKRKSTGFLLADEQSSVESLGDEPYQIHNKFPKIAVAVDADRRNGIALLEKQIKPDVILLDDAFQHRKVKAGLNILLTAYGKLYCDDWYLPTGNLRDSKREAKRADVIVVTKCPSNISNEQQKQLRDKIRPNANQQLLFSCLVNDAGFHSRKEVVDISAFKGKKVSLVTGIADSQPLKTYLEGRGLAFEHLSYTDHHFFTTKELVYLNSKEVVITTEKDFMRLKEHIGALYYIPVRHEFVGDDGAQLANVVTTFMKQGI